MPKTRQLAVALCAALLLPGCILSRLVDRAFIGVTNRNPTYERRKATGFFLLPLTAAVDLATFPIQALLLVILGDKWPFHDRSTSVNTRIASIGRFHGIPPELQKAAFAELERRVRDGEFAADDVVALGADGQWIRVQVSPATRERLIAQSEALPYPLR